MHVMLARPASAGVFARALRAAIYAVLLVACDSPLAPGDGGVGRIEVVPASIAMVAGETQSITARVYDPAGNLVTDRRPFWSTQNAAVATVTQSGIVTAVGSGATQIGVSVGGKSALVTATVSARPVASVRVSPSPATVLEGATVALTAEALDATGGVIAGRSATWASGTVGVATVSASGVVTGVAPGNATISATIDGRVGSAVVTVQPVPVASVSVTPATGSVVVGRTLQLAAAALDARGTTLANRVIVWSSSNNLVATVSSTGLVSGIAPGTANITATSEGKSGTAAVVATAVPVAAVAVTPANPTIASGQTLQLAARVTDSDGNVLNGRAVTWTSDQPSIATVNASGVLTAIGTGGATITATSETRSGTTFVTVTPVPVASLSIAPTAASIVVGAKQQFTATALDAAGKALPGRVVTWITGAPSVASVDQNGLVTAIAPGSAVIFAACEGRSVNVTVTVSAVGVGSVRVTPGTGTLEQGRTLQLAAAVLDGAGNPVSGKLVTWASSNNAIATVSSAGLAVGITPGTATITATSDGVSGTATINVTLVTVASVSIIPNAASIAPGANFALTAILLDSAGNQISPANRVITWTTSNPSAASVNTQGVVTGVAAGTTIISAATGIVFGTATITVTSTLVPIASITVAPATTALSVGGTQQLTATARDAAGNVLTGRTINWASSAPSIATVSSTGLATALAVGASTITASSPGSSATGTAGITVGFVPVATVTVLPNPAGVQQGQTTTFTANLYDALNNLLSPTGRTITWASSDPSKATINATTGVATGVATTTAPVTITATVATPGQTPNKTGTASLSVSQVPVVSVAVSPTTATVHAGAIYKRTFTATPLDASGNPLPYPVVWSSSDPTNATVNSAGEVTGLSTGPVRIDATSVGITGSANVTVDLVPVSSVSVAPSATSLLTGQTQSHTATARDSANNIISGAALGGRVASWVSSAPAVASVDAAGVVTGVTSGSANISATIDATTSASPATVTVLPAVSSISVVISPDSAIASSPTHGTTSGMATIFGAGNVPLPNRSVTLSWSSSNTGQALVSPLTATSNSSGQVPFVVTGVQGGTVIVSVSSGGVTGSDGLRVLNAVATVAVVTSPDSVIGSGTASSTVTLRDAGGATLSGRPVTWSSTNTPVATVNGAGAVTSVGAGTTSIRATAEGKLGSATFRVLEPVSSVTITSPTAGDSIIAGIDTRQILVTLQGASGATLSGRPITYQSRNPAIASVTAGGVISGVVAGTTYILATSEGKVDSVVVRSLSRVASASYSIATDSIIGSGSVPVVVTLLDANGSAVAGRAITSVSSSNGAIITVSPTFGVSDGAGRFTITATAGATAGSATVSVQSDNVTSPSTTPIRVLAPVAAVTVTPNPLGVSPGATATMTITLTSGAGTPLAGRVVSSVTSSNTGVATVATGALITNSSGQITVTITGVAAGTASITATAEGVAGSAAVTVP